MSIVRWLRHWFKTPYSVRRAFSEPALERIQQAIADSERNHAGEIRFAIEAALPWSYLKRGAPARQRAAMVFAKLRVWDTEHNNGVLIYVELADQSIEIVADRGIDTKVGKAEWERICAGLEKEFRAGLFEYGVIKGIEEVSRLMAQHFPKQAGGSNELPDAPVVL